jgi:two-component system sensor histidine kinase QseC
VHHAPRGSRVTCSAEAGGDRWTLVVENAAPALEPRDLTSMAEPFWRKDGSRADRQRTGLGLALSRRLADRCNLALDFRLEQGRLQARLSGPHRTRAQAPVGSAGS